MGSARVSIAPFAVTTESPTRPLVSSRTSSARTKVWRLPTPESARKTALWRVAESTDQLSDPMETSTQTSMFEYASCMSQFPLEIMPSEFCSGEANLIEKVNLKSAKKKKGNKSKKSKKSKKNNSDKTD